MPDIVKSKKHALLSGVSSVRSISNPYDISISEEITPNGVRSRLLQARLGYIGALHVLYKNMLTDSMYSGLHNSLKSSISTCPLNINRGDMKTRRSKKAYKIVKEQFKRLNVSRMIKQMITPYFNGCYAASVDWELMPSNYSETDLYWIRGLTILDPSRYQVGMNPESPDSFNKLLITSMDYPEGLPWDKFQYGSILYADNGEVDEGYFHLAGAARRCLSWWLAKRFSQTYWSEFNETFAEPIRVAYVDESTTTDEKKQLKKFLEYLGRNMYSIFDEKVDIELMESNKMGTVTTFSELIKTADNQMSVAVAGQIESSGSGNKFGSNAKAETHFKVRGEIVSAIAHDINSQISKLVDYICYYNVSEDMMEEEKPVATLQIPRPEDKKTLAEVYNVVTGILPVTKRQIYRDLEIEEPEEGEETIGPENRNNRLQDQSSSKEVPTEEPTEGDS